MNKDRNEQIRETRRSDQQIDDEYKGCEKTDGLGATFSAVETTGKGGVFRA